jgi:hypothetical protein
MALRRDAVAGNKIVREKKFLGIGWWVHDYSYQNTLEYHKLMMNKAVDEFAKHETELKLEEQRLKALTKEVGSSSGKLKSWGDTYHIPGLIATPEERKKFTKPIVSKQNEDWKPFARVLHGYGSSLMGKASGGETKHFTTDVGKPDDLVMDGTHTVFPVPKGGGGNQNQNRNNNKRQNGQH